MMLASHQNLNDFARLDYWDSYWIVCSVLKSELPNIVNDALQDFVDQIECFHLFYSQTAIHYLSFALRLCMGNNISP